MTSCVTKVCDSAFLTVLIYPRFGLMGGAIIRNSLRYLDYVNQFVGVLEPDSGGVPRFVALNRFAYRQTGWAPSDVIGKSAIELFPGRTGKTAYDAHVLAFETGNQNTFETLMKIGGQKRTFLTTLAPERRKDGQVLRVFATAVDVSGSGLFEDASFDRSDAEDFVKLAAHDLRSPVRNLKAISGLLREDFTDMGDGKVELLDMLDTVTETAMKLLDDIVMFAQTTVPGKAADTVFEFHELVRELMDVLDPFSSSDAHAKMALVRGDRNVMQTVLRNLIDNAIKHCARDESDFRLNLVFAVESNGLDKIDLTVEDNGGGFKDTALLFMNGGALKPGSGFGLLGVRRLIHARGGTISAATLPGARARVTVTLPGTLLSSSVKTKMAERGQLRA